jgi:hypothetical protein
VPHRWAYDLRAAMKTKMPDHSDKNDATEVQKEERYAEMVQYFKTALSEDMHIQQQKNAASQRPRASLPVFW